MILGLVFVAGCSSSASNDYSKPPSGPSGGYVGGGCGVQGPVMNEDVSQTVDLEFLGA